MSREKNQMMWALEALLWQHYSKIGEFLVTTSLCALIKLTSTSLLSPLIPGVFSLWCWRRTLAKRMMKLLRNFPCSILRRNSSLVMTLFKPTQAERYWLLMKMHSFIEVCVSVCVHAHVLHAWMHHASTHSIS